MIGPMPLPGVAEGLAGISAGMAGMTPSQAWNANGFEDPATAGYGVDFGVNPYVSSKPAISGNTSNTVEDSSEPDPIDVFDDYVDSGAEVSEVTGGPFYGSTVGTFAYSLLEKQDPLTQVEVVTAVAAVAIPIEKAYVAISQALGVSMNSAELQEEVKQAFVNSITSTPGLVYDAARDLVAAWWDGVNILFPKKAIDAVYSAIQETGADVFIDTYTYQDKNVYTAMRGVVPFEEEISWYVTVGDGAFVDAGTLYVYGTDPDVDVVMRRGTQEGHALQRTSVTVDGVTYYYRHGWFNLSPYPSDATLPATTDFGRDPAACIRAIVRGTKQENPEVPGTAQSSATSYTPSTLPSGGRIMTSDSDSEETVPIYLPPTDNTIGDTTDPTSPSDDDDVGALPLPPLPLPIPDDNISNPDVPLTDATIINSELIDALVDSLAETLDPQPPQSSGLIPFPFMPGLPVDPDDPSAGSQYPSIVPASGSGFIHVYNPTPAEFVSFGNWLWVTYADATIEKIWNNPFDGVLGAHELYATPSNDGTDNIRSGFLVCPTTAALVRQRYTEIDCGSIIIPEFYKNYLDYSPYSQAYVYLPFIGIQEVSVDDFVGHAINIRYRVDAYNGSCIAMIYVAKQGYRNLCYQFAGNCAVEVPLAGGSQAAIKAGMMQAEAYATAGVQSAGLTGIAQALGGLAGGLAHGGLAGALGGLASGAISGLASYGAAKINAGATREAARVANKSSVQHSGTFGASHGAMGLKIPFVMIRNPIQVKVVNYNNDYGFPAHKRVVIGGCTGYLRVKEVNVISAHATNEEKIAIEEALKAGVFVT